MAARLPARASPELRETTCSPRYPRNYTTPGDTTSPWRNFCALAGAVIIIKAASAKPRKRTILILQHTKIQTAPAVLFAIHDRAAKSDP